MCGQKNIADMLIHNNLQISVILNGSAVAIIHLKTLLHIHCDIMYIYCVAFVIILRLQTVQKQMISRLGPLAFFYF